MLSLAAIALLSVKDPKDKDPKDKDKGPRQIPLPTSKLLNTPSPGRLGSLNSFPATIALSRDGRYAALLNDGYGTQDDQAHQSIAVLDLNTNQIADFPDDHLPENAHQSYFLGLAFSSDGSHLYASMGSITDPTGEGAGDTGNGIAVYKIQQGKITPERFIKIAPQKIAHDKQVAIALRKTATGTAIPYPAGLTVVSGQGEDKLLVANNLSDNVVLLDPRDGRILEQFDLSTHQMIPASFPYTVVATRDGRHAWCSLWNASQVAELDLEKGTVARWIALLGPKEPTDPGSHPTALLLSPDENLLYVTLSNADKVAVLSTRDARHVGMLYTAVPRQKFAGTYPNALALSAGGKRLFVADASLNAIAVFDVSRIGPDNPVFDLPIQKALGFIPTDWYPSALATVGDDLLIATAKGQGTGPNNGINGLKQEKRRREHRYIATLLYGSLSRLNFRDAEKRLAEFTRQVEDSNLFLSDPGRIQFQRGSNPIRHVIYVIKENRAYDQILGDLKVGNGDSSLTMYGADHVDAHRSIAFVISKYSPGSVGHPFMDHRFYTTVNMVQTIESLLGLPPMNHNDAYAPMMASLFSGEGSQPPFSADWSNRDNGLIYQTNPAKGQGAQESAKMDFSCPDAVNPSVLNAILWRDRKGSTPLPESRHQMLPARMPVNTKIKTRSSDD